MTAGTRGLPAAARAIGDRLPVRELPMGTLEPVDALCGLSGRLPQRSRPECDSRSGVEPGRPESPATQPWADSGDGLPLSDGPTAAPIGIAPAEVNADPGIPLVSPETPSAATLSLPALRAEAERLGKIRRGQARAQVSQPVRASLCPAGRSARGSTMAVERPTMQMPRRSPRRRQMVTSEPAGMAEGHQIETPQGRTPNTPVKWYFRRQ